MNDIARPPHTTHVPYVLPSGELDMDAINRSARHAAMHGRGYGDATLDEKLAWELEHFLVLAREYQAVARNRLARGETLR
jgi:hypothetical protein